MRWIISLLLTVSACGGAVAEPPSSNKSDSGSEAGPNGSCEASVVCYEHDGGACIDTCTGKPWPEPRDSGDCECGWNGVPCVGDFRCLPIGK